MQGEGCGDYGYDPRAGVRVSTFFECRQTSERKKCKNLTKIVLKLVHKSELKSVNLFFGNCVFLT